MNRFRIPCGVFSLFLILLLNLLAASPTLHELIHTDANSATHQCAVAMFAHGQVDSAPVEIHSVMPAALIEVTPQTAYHFFSPTIENLPAGRAPPVSASSLV